jgi:hypothetical protein
VEWGEKGCNYCRNQIIQGQHLNEPKIMSLRHTVLSQCNECGAYWEEFERFSDLASADSIEEYKNMKQEEDNTFVELVLKVKNQQVPVYELISHLSRAYLIVPSVSTNNSFEPLLLNGDGKSLVAVFTSIIYLKPFADEISFYNEIKFLDVVKATNQTVENGLVVNPNSATCFTISPEGLRDIIHDFC